MSLLPVSRQGTKMGFQDLSLVVPNCSPPELTLTLNFRPEGFGLGALNDADDDDVDVYDNGLPKESRRMAFETGDEDHETIVLGHRGPVSKVREIFILVPILTKNL